MTSGVYKIPPLCQRCGVAPAAKFYCRTCAPIVKNEKKRANKKKNSPLGLLVVDGLKRAPKIKIISDPLPGGFPSGTEFTGKFDIECMLSSGAFTDNTIVEAGGRMLRIVDNKFCPLDKQDEKAYYE